MSVIGHADRAGHKGRSLGESRSIHRFTSVASCSNARLSGFWQLNLICANSRPTQITLSLTPYLH